MIRILLAEDQQIVRDGLIALMKDDPGITVVCDAADGQAAKEMLQQHVIDVALLDIEMPNANGLEVTKYIKQHHSDVKVIILSMHKHPQYINAAINMEADGYILKGNVDQEELILAIKEVAAGGMHFGSEVINVKVKAQREKYKQDQKRAHLTKREKEVAACLLEGHSGKEIAEILHIAPNTVETHSRNLKDKLKAKNMAHLVRKIMEGRYLDEE